MNDRGAILAGALLLVYLWIAPSHIGYGDNAEFSSLAALGGAAHPSGYPAYVIWLRLWSWLPGSAAHAAACATALLGVLQMYVLHAACRAWGAGTSASTLAVGVYALSPIALRIYSEAEVFALNGLVVALVLLYAAPNSPLRGTRRVLVLAVVAGLGLSNHLTCALVAPVGLLGTVRGFREARGSFKHALGAGLAGLVVGLCPYVYLLAVPATPVSWGEVDGLRGLVHHVLRFDYGGPWGLSGRHAERQPAANLRALVASIGSGYLWMPAAAGLTCMLWLAARGPDRAGWRCLLVSWLLAGPLFVCRFNIEPVGLHRYVVERFHLLPLALLAVPTAYAFDVALRRARERTRAATLPRIVGAMAVLVLVARGAISLPSVAVAHSFEVEQGLVNILRTLPRDAILIGSTDVLHFGMGYLQSVEGQRADVSVIATPQLGLPHYRERVYKATGIVVQRATGGQKLSVSVAESALATGRPVFIDPLQANIAMSLPTYPYGIVFRVLPRGAAVPPPEVVLAINKDVFARYELGYVPPGPGEPAELHPQYARTWQMLSGALAGPAHRDARAFALDMAEKLSPR